MNEVVVELVVSHSSANDVIFIIFMRDYFDKYLCIFEMPERLDVCKVGWMIWWFDESTKLCRYIDVIVITLRL